MDTSRVLDAGFDQAGAMFADVRADQLGASTPCAGWDVRTLMNHVVAANTMFAAIVNDDELDLSIFERDLLGDDPVGTYQRAAKSAQGAWHRAGAFDRSYEMPWSTADADVVEVPANVVAGANLAELVMHSWDLSRATGQQLALAEDLVRSTLDVVRGPDMQPYWNQEGEFAPPVECGRSVAVADRLAAMFGRQLA